MNHSGWIGAGVGNTSRFVARAARPSGQRHSIRKSGIVQQGVGIWHSGGWRQAISNLRGKGLEALVNTAVHGGGASSASLWKGKTTKLRQNASRAVGERPSTGSSIMDLYIMHKQKRRAEKSNKWTKYKNKKHSYHK